MANGVFPGGKTVAVVTSWDDGTLTDRIMAETLEKYGFKGTFYVCSEHIGKTTHHDLPDKPGHLDLNSLREIAAAGHEIASHSLDHPRLGTLTPEEVTRQMTESKAKLEELFGVPVPSFAYPYGLPEGRDDIAETVRAAGYASARIGRQEANMTAASLAGGDWMRLPVSAYFTEDFATIQEKWERAQKTDGGIFHLWGHSVDLGEDRSHWADYERVLDYLGGVHRVWYTTVGAMVAAVRQSR